MKTIDNIVKGAIVAGALIATTGCSNYDITNTRLENIPKGYNKLVSHTIPTQGNVIRVRLLENEMYTQKVMDNKLEICGNKIEYEIQPDRQFTPKDMNHSDIYGRTPQNNNYWVAQRKGCITLEKDK